MQFDRLRRREFIALLGGAAATWPVAARAQQGERMRRIGVLNSLAADDQEGQARVKAFVQGLAQLGWIDGQNVRIDYRWAAGEQGLSRKNAAAMMALAPDVILASGSTTVGALLQASRTVPIVFVLGADPVSARFVESLARPGGNATGFTNIEYSMSAKWLELLREIAPWVTRVVILWDQATYGAVGQLGSIQAAATSFGVELRPVDARDGDKIEPAIATLARESNGGLIALSGASVAAHRAMIIALANHNRLPAVYPYRYYITGGGLIYYGPDRIDPYRRAAGYIDRILKGEKPADLPVQAPTKYELVINLKTAKALGLDVPPMLLARADEVIE